jgi:hypothetical protein
MPPSLCVLAFALLPWPRPATTRVSSVVLLGAGGDSGRGRGDDAAVSPLALTHSSHPRRHPASRACLEDLGQLTVPQLKQRLRVAGLKLSGRKAELVQRLLGTEAASSAEEAPLGSPAAAASAETHGTPGSSTAASSAEVHGATGLHPGASLPSATFSLVHADASLLVVDKGAGK